MNTKRRAASGDSRSLRNRVAALERLIGWIPMKTRGLGRVLEDLTDVRRALSRGEGLDRAMSLLASDLKRMYPRGAIVSLASRRARTTVLELMAGFGVPARGATAAGSARGAGATAAG